MKFYIINGPNLNMLGIREPDHYGKTTYTHTSIALLDAVKSTSLPTVEIHISAVETREAFRQISFIREACIKTITGEGIMGYLHAIDDLSAYLRKEIE